VREATFVHLFLASFLGWKDHLCGGAYFWDTMLWLGVMILCDFIFYYGRVVFISRQSNNERAEIVDFIYSQKENALFVLDLE